VTAGIHGTEYPGIEAARRFGLELDPGNLSGQVVIVHIANPTAFYRRSIYVSGFEDQNLNRMFPGKEEGTSTERLAYALFHQVIRRADLYVDLHGGDMIEALAPFVAYVDTPTHPRQTESARRLALAYGIKYVCKGTTPGSAYVTAGNSGIPTLLAEAGGQGILSEQDVQVHLHGLRNILYAFKMVTGIAVNQITPVFIRDSVSLRSEVRGLYYPTVRLDEQVTHGQRLGHITDSFGESAKDVVSPVTGYVKWVVTSLAINPGDPLMSIAVPEDR